MDIGTISLVLLLGMLFLLAIGMPLGFASGFLAVVVMVMKFGPDLLFGTFGTGPMNILAQRMYGLTTDYVLISVPLFILMATLLERSGIAKDMYSSLSIWLNRTRGGIALVTSVMAVIMAAMSGIIGGEVVLLGLIALPQMLRLGYDQNLAIGTICASGSLGTMIPPSIVLIFYGLITETSIQALFKGAFVPGFILAGCYMLYIVIRTRITPSMAPLPEASDDDMSGPEKRLYGSALLAMIAILILGVTVIRTVFLNVMGRVVDDVVVLTPTQLTIRGAIIVALLAYLLFVVKPARVKAAWDVGKGMIAPLLVVGVVLGSIYGGITGITEAAGMGTIAVVLLIIARGEMSFTLVKEALMRTWRSTGTIIWVTFGATALAGAYTIAGGPTYVANLISGYELPTLGVLFVMMIIFLFLGAFMDWVGIVLLVMPVFLPIVLNLPIEEIGVFGPLAADPRFLSVWFGILFCVNMQVSFLSPPFGPAAFYLKSVAPPHITLPDIFKGFLPFIAIQLFVLMLILFFPELTMFFRGKPVLTKDQVATFARQGYLVVEDVLPAAVQAAVRSEYSALCDTLYAGWATEGRVSGTAQGFEERLLEAYAAGCDWFQPMDISLPGDRVTEHTPMHFGPAVFDMITTQPLLDIAQSLIGPEITSNPIQHVRIKPPAQTLRTDERRAHITRTEWHQDRAVALAEADGTDMITIWIAITDATPENGCLQVVPFGDRREMLPHCPKLQTAIADGFLDEDRAKPLPVGAGGIVILHPLIPHASLPNVTDTIRWSFDIRFNRTGQPTGRAHFPAFVARSAANPGSALQDWRIWKKDWEDARTALARTPHIDIHRWSSDAPFCA